MTWNPILPGQASLSIDGESIPFTMEAEVDYTTLDEAIASGLFDMPDEPGMVRIPVTMDVMIPNHILFPPGPPPGDDVADQADFVPFDAGSGRAPTRFGNYPGVIAAVNIARTFKTADEEARERAYFRNLLDVLRPKGLVASEPVADAAHAADAPMPGAAPIQRVQFQEQETRPGPAGSELSPAEASREEAFAEASRQLAALEPKNPLLQRMTAPGWVPEEAVVEGVERELAAAEARAMARSAPTGPGDLPLRPISGEPSIETQLGLPPLLKPFEPVGKPADGIEQGFPQSSLASYKEGESDGGPGKWVVDSPKSPRNPEHAIYQQRATGAPPGMEYKVPAPVRLKASGVKLFDGYDPITGNLLDAKRYVDWPTEKFDLSIKLTVTDMTDDGEIAAYNGRKLEIRVATAEKAALLEKLIEVNGIADVSIRVVPDQ